MAFASDIFAGSADAGAGVGNYQGISLPGQENLLGDRDALFLMQMGSEIARALQANLVFAQTVTRMQFRGKAIQLPYFGRASAGYHETGVNILDPSNLLLTTVRGADRQLYPDKPLVSAVLVDEWDELVSHLPTRMIYTEELGRAQAHIIDNIIARNVMLGAAVAADAIFTGHPGGNVVTGSQIGYDMNGNTTISAGTFADKIRELRLKFDQKNVPMAGRKIAMSPANYQVICQDTDLFDVQYSPSRPGDFTKGEITGVFGFEIVVTTNGPFDNNTYTGMSNGGSGGQKEYELALGNDVDATDEVLRGTAFAGAGIGYSGSTAPALQAQARLARKNSFVNTTVGGSNSYITSTISAFDAEKVVAIAWAPRAVVMGTLRGLKLETENRIDYGATLIKLSQIQGCTYWHPEACGVIANT